MKRIILIIISVLMISSVMLLVACGQPEDDKTHDEILKEISDLNRANNEKRQTFLSSEIYAEAYAYLSNTLDELLPESEYEISLEPQCRQLKQNVMISRSFQGFPSRGSCHRTVTDEV